MNYAVYDQTSDNTGVVKLDCGEKVLEVFQEYFEIEMMQGDVTEVSPGKYAATFDVEGIQNALAKAIVIQLMNPDPSLN